VKNEGPLPPVDIIQTEPEDIGGPYPIARVEQEYGIISHPQGARAVYATENLVEFGFCENIRESCVAKMLCPSHRER